MSTRLYVHRRHKRPACSTRISLCGRKRYQFSPKPSCTASRWQSWLLMGPLALEPLCTAALGGHLGWVWGLGAKKSWADAVSWKSHISGSGRRSPGGWMPFSVAVYCLQQQLGLDEPMGWSQLARSRWLETHRQGFWERRVASQHSRPSLSREWGLVTASWCTYIAEVEKSKGQVVAGTLSIAPDTAQH